jgi:epoxide hydrolase-like predicted phosphatase
MSISAVIWDLGGVLVRTEDQEPRQSLANSLRVRRSELEEAVFSGESGARAQRGELGVEEHWQNVGRQFGLDAPGLREFQQKFWGGDRVDGELVDYIRSLRGSYKTGLLSNAFGDLREYLTTVWKFADAFDDLLISSEVGLVKPDPAIYRLALQRLGVASDQAVFIDDMPVNVDGARRVGMHAIRFLSPAQARAELGRLINGAER